MDSKTFVLAFVAGVVVGGVVCYALILGGNALQLRVAPGGLASAPSDATPPEPPHLLYDETG